MSTRALVYAALFNLPFWLAVLVGVIALARSG